MESVADCVFSDWVPEHYAKRADIMDGDCDSSGAVCMVDSHSFQTTVAESLGLLLQKKGFNPQVEPRWKALRHRGRTIYSPEVDIAVGPFATGAQLYEDEYDTMVRSFADLIDKWVRMFRLNWQNYVSRYAWTVLPNSPSGHSDFIAPDANRNARCFIAIEVEDETTRKHLMGSIVNAGALGRVGILVAWQDKVLRAAIRMRQYFEFLQEARKRTFNMSNVIVLSRDELAASLNTRQLI